MYYKLSVDERKARRDKYRANPIYRILYTPLWKQRGNDLSPEDVWEEANNLAFELKSVSDDDIEIIVAELFDDLCENYSTFIIDGDEVKRSFGQAQHSAMMVSLTAFLLLADVYPEAHGHPYIKICQSLTDVMENIPGYYELYEEARDIEDEYERKGEFIEVADFIEQIANRETPLSPSEKKYAQSIMGQFVDESQFSHLDTLKENEVVISRISDKNNHIFQPELDKLRGYIKNLQGGDEVRLEYENIIFAQEYEDKITDIRNAIYPFLKDSPDHINADRQNEWLAIIEPLRNIDGLLRTHDERPRKRDCTDGEICTQMDIFFGDQFKSIDFSKIPKSISGERRVWRNNNVGLSFSDWNRYTNMPGGIPKYKALAKVAYRVYGEILKAIREGK